jgi:hypothetical protein
LYVLNEATTQSRDEASVIHLPRPLALIVRVIVVESGRIAETVPHERKAATRNPVPFLALEVNGVPYILLNDVVLSAQLVRQGLRGWLGHDACA